MGVRKTTDFLEKTTWILAATVILLSILAVGVKSGEVVANDSQIKEKVLEQQEAMQNAIATPDFAEQSEGEEVAE